MMFTARPITALLGLLSPCAVALASSTSSDRIALTGNGSTLTGTNGGEGGAIGWLHNFNPDAIITLGAEHQRIGDAYWSFGTLTGAISSELGNGRYTFSGEAHEGSGKNGVRPLKYEIEALQATATYFHRLSVQLEVQRIDVDTLHGNLPEITVSYLWTPHWLTSFSRSDSAGGNLGTQLDSLRIDRYGKHVNLIVGGSYGRASLIIIDGLGVVAPGHILREGYIGASKLFAQRTEVTLTGDYQNLSGSKRATVTLSFMFHLGSLEARR
jgi:hypothetical protein